MRADCLREVPDYSAARSFPSISRCQTPYSTDVAQTLSPMNRANSGYGKLAFPNSETQEADFKCCGIVPVSRSSDIVLWDVELELQRDCTQVRPVDSQI